MARWAEVWVGLLDHQDEFEVIYATFLLPGIRASTTCISAGTASSRHKKRRPRRLFRFLRCPSQGRAAMALARQRRHQQALASLMGNAGSWLHQQRSMGSPPTRRRTPARRSPGRHGCSSSHRVRPCRASWASLSMVDHWPISVTVRPQPRQSPSLARQSPMQGTRQLIRPHLPACRSPRGGCCAPR